MDLIFVSFGLSIAFILMFKIEWLFHLKSFLLLFLYTILLFGISYLLLEHNIGKPRIVSALKMPIVSITIFKLITMLFKIIYKRNPENTAWTYTKKPIEDVLFSIIFWFLGVGLPIFLI